MTFLIILNNKEPDFLMGMLLFFISKDNLFFKFLKDGSLDYLVVIIEELTTSCVTMTAVPNLSPDGHTYNRSFLFCVYTIHYSKNQKV
jgi:hypothetical protein